MEKVPLDKAGVSWAEESDLNEDDGEHNEDSEDGDGDDSEDTWDCEDGDGEDIEQGEGRSIEF